jgi:glycosyltransferase involved in cell wall biosynthesis
VVVVEDGSSDESWEIIESLVSSHPRLTAGRHRQGRNLGEGASRQLGLSLSRGHYVLYLTAMIACCPDDCSMIRM